MTHGLDYYKNTAVCCSVVRTTNTRNHTSLHCLLFIQAIFITYYFLVFAASYFIHPFTGRRLSGVQFETTKVVFMYKVVQI